MFRYPRPEGDCDAAGNAAMSAAGGEKRKPLEKWAFRGVCPPSFFSKKFTLAKGEEATFRYPVRVVSSGDCILPGPSVEAMYHPELHARRAPSRISVKR